MNKIFLIAILVSLILVSGCVDDEQKAKIPIKCFNVKMDYWFLESIDNEFETFEEFKEYILSDEECKNVEFRKVMREGKGRIIAYGDCKTMATEDYIINYGTEGCSNDEREGELYEMPCIDLFNKATSIYNEQTELLLRDLKNDGDVERFKENRDWLELMDEEIEKCKRS